MKFWEKEKNWSSNFFPEIKKILGLYLIGESNREEDQERNTDLIVLKMDAVRIACRVRRYKYVNGFQNEFTIRSKLSSGCKTELTKIIQGWGDYIFYGFSDLNEELLSSWFLGDLDVFRLWFARYQAKNKCVPGIPQKNKDNISSFISFKLEEFPSDFIIARKQYKFVLKLGDKIFT